MNLARIPFLPSTDIYAPIDRVKAVRATLGGAEGFARAKGEPDVRRIVELGAGVGAFTAYAFLRWPHGWADCYEPLESDRDVLGLNAPAGTRIFDAIPEVVPPCDLLRIAMPLQPGTAFSKTHLGRLKIAIVNFYDSEQLRDYAAMFTDLGMRVAAADVHGPGCGVMGWVKA